MQKLNASVSVGGLVFRKDEVIDDPQVIDLSKEFIRNSIVNNGLIKADNKLNINTKYKSYDYYV